MPLQNIDVLLEAQRDSADTSVFLGLEFDISFVGIDKDAAETLLESYKTHCPLYKTVAAVWPVSMKFQVVAGK
jgi:uncharacterized OsmC-like protein